MILNRVNYPEDLRKLNIKELDLLTNDIRKYIIDIVSKKGGHLAPSLGTVELTIALHYIFDSPKDKIVFDVGHQSYTHKIITGRKEMFRKLRQYKGLSGFTNRNESEYDPFGAGHVGTAISSALGLAVARDIAGEDNKVIAVVGDGGLTSGLSYEGLNNAGYMHKDIIVVLNDNKMSIDKNVGSIALYLARITTTPEYYTLKSSIWNLINRMTDRNERINRFMSRMRESLKTFFIPTETIFFEGMGFHYFGPYDGHNIRELIEVFKFVKRLNEPVFIHVITEKGKGYKNAENNPILFHGLGPFDIESGKANEPINGREKYTNVFSSKMVELGKKYGDIVAITAAMPQGTGLVEFREKFPDRFYDVGIAEQHAVTFAGGLAAGGMHPFVVIYSTFLQRSYDSIVHDIALQNLPVVFCIDRAGIVGEDGPTHHGVFDIAYLRTIPNIVIMAPKDKAEFESMLEFAASYYEHPIAIRYPREGIPKEFGIMKKIQIGKSEIVYTSKINNTVILAVGTGNIIARDIINNEHIECDHINLRFVKPLDIKLIKSVAEYYKYVISIEEGSIKGGINEEIITLLNRYGFKGIFTAIGLADHFITFGKRETLLEKEGFTSKCISKVIKGMRGY
jgi:1-deoxy-D-xylulose-5-phosphate synthase